MLVRCATDDNQNSLGFILRKIKTYIFSAQNQIQTQTIIEFSSFDHTVWIFNTNTARNLNKLSLYNGRVVSRKYYIYRGSNLWNCRTQVRWRGLDHHVKLLEILSQPEYLLSILAMVDLEIWIIMCLLCV